MTENAIVVPIAPVANAFLIRGTSFIVTGPTNDLSLQIAFCEDVVRHDDMTISQTHDGGVNFDFSGVPQRLTLGTVKMSLQHAIELTKLLQDHIEKTQALMKSLEGSHER